MGCHWNCLQIFNVWQQTCHEWGNVTCLIIVMILIQYSDEDSYLFQIICLGYYDMEWSKLDPRPQYDIMIRFVLILIHNILIVPICIKRYRHEMDESNARTKLVVENTTMNISKSLESFFSNCFIMGIFFIGIFVLNEYGRWVPIAFHL